ncbi:FAD-dependent monooxygenase [Fredinandcohnia sp. FSL W7-1320]|uniref:FAD-dependent monooxygenase n=1 Tax=Fredinandcohnia sp. FSL W7-1320 TaxID=2954540 RepID=UPI0030FD2FF6
MTNEADVIVVGGGIGGLAAAYSLGKVGKTVIVLEQAPQFSEVGAGLQLGPNALRALDSIGLLEEVYKYSVLPKRHVFMDAIEQRELSALNFGEGFRERYGYPYVVMHRTDLHSVLLEGCRSLENVKTYVNHKVSTIENLDRSVRVTCENGNIYNGGFLVGADGLWSTVRKFVVNDEPVTSQYVAYRGTVPMDEMKVQIDWDEKYTWIGPGLHMVQYPIREKKVINQVAVFKSTRYENGEADWGTPEELDEAFSKCCPTLQHSLKYINRDRNWKMFDREPVSNWTVGRVTLLGDSAHAMLQYLAQGACQALEDACCLTEKVLTYQEDIEKALIEYQNERIPRTSAVQRGARTWGEMKHAEDPVTILLRNTVMLNRTEDDFKYVDWLYSEEAFIAK